MVYIHVIDKARRVAPPQNLVLSQDFRRDFLFTNKLTSRHTGETETSAKCTVGARTTTVTNSATYLLGKSSFSSAVLVPFLTWQGSWGKKIHAERRDPSVGRGTAPISGDGDCPGGNPRARWRPTDMEAGAGCRGGADGRTGIRTQSISVRYPES